MVAELLIQILILTVLAILTALAVILWMLWGLREKQRFKRVVLIEGIERAEQEQDMQEFKIDLTKGGKKNERFKPLNIFGAESQWDPDNPLHVVTSEGPATFEPTTANFAGEPYPPDQAGQWFLLKSNGGVGTTVVTFEGDGHTEADGEEESIVPVTFTVTVTATAADVKTVALEESEEIPE